MRPVVVQGHKDVTVNATGYGFDTQEIQGNENIKYLMSLFFFLFSIHSAAVEAKRAAEPLNTSTKYAEHIPRTKCLNTL